jgi:hypothetical protein
MNREDNPLRRSRLDVPPRRRAQSTPQKPEAEKAETGSHYSKSDLEKMRQNYGFDNIPVEDEDMDGVRLRDIIRAWILQATGRKEKPVDQKNSRLRAIKNDIKWALQADLDEPVKPYVKPPVATSREQPGAPSPAQNTPGPNHGRSIDINISFASLPSLSTIKKQVQKVIRYAQKRKRLTASIATVAVVSFIAIQIIPVIIGEPGLRKEDIASTKPEFNTLLPNGKSIDNLGGWKRVSPPGAAPAFAYSDKIGSVTIAVSQQTLPDEFKGNTSDRMTELAKGFNATEKLTTENGTTIYLGSSAQGPQSAILAIDHLLILIKSTNKIDDKKWASYVDSMISPVQKF